MQNTPCSPHTHRECQESSVTYWRRSNILGVALTTKVLLLQKCAAIPRGPRSKTRGCGERWRRTVESANFSVCTWSTFSRWSRTEGTNISALVLSVVPFCDLSSSRNFCTHSLRKPFPLRTLESLQSCSASFAIRHFSESFVGEADRTEHQPCFNFSLQIGQHHKMIALNLYWWINEV